MNICLFEPDEIGLPLDLGDKRTVHILKVLRKAQGDSFCAGVIGGQAGRALITRIVRDEQKAHKGKLFFEFVPESEGKRLFPLAVVVGFSRPVQMRRILRDLSSLGVAEIHLALTDLSEKSYLSSSLATKENCRAFLIEGAVQAGSTHLPELSLHLSLAKCLDTLQTKMSDCALFALDNVAPVQSLGAALRMPPQAAVAAVGSERGWTQEERQLLRARGFTLVGLGERVLRVETACTAATSLILSAMGYLRLDTDRML